MQALLAVIFLHLQGGSQTARLVFPQVLNALPREWLILKGAHESNELLKLPDSFDKFT